jgi:hypothetical protein
MHFVQKRRHKIYQDAARANSTRHSEVLALVSSQMSHVTCLCELKYLVTFFYYVFSVPYRMRSAVQFLD